MRTRCILYCPVSLVLKSCFDSIMTDDIDRRCAFFYIWYLNSAFMSSWLNAKYIFFIKCWNKIFMLSIFFSGLLTTKLGTYLENRINSFLKKKDAAAGEVTIRVLSSSDKMVEVRPLMKQKWVRRIYKKQILKLPIFKTLGLLIITRS